MKSNFTIIFSVFTLAIVFCLPKPTWGQCDLQFDYSVENTDSINGSNIIITNNGEEGTYLFQLYDLYQAKVIDKKSQAFGSNEKVSLFEDIPPSTYTIYVTRNDCSKHITLGGKYGLVVEAKK